VEEIKRDELYDGWDRRPIPDPTDLTSEALARAVKAERDYVDGKVSVLGERLDGMDRATKLLSETVNRVPTILTKEIDHLTSLVDERFSSVTVQFKERDTRSERESRDNKVAVDAAFAAQKEAAAKQDEANSKAIDKSEKATTETIKTLADSNRAFADALGGKIDDLKERVARIESVKQGAQESTEAGRDSNRNIGVIISTALALVFAIVALIGFTRTSSPNSNTGSSCPAGFVCTAK
jgi:cation transport regulator ChaB